MDCLWKRVYNGGLSYRILWLRMNRETRIRTNIKKLIPPFQTQINLYTQLYIDIQDEKSSYVVDSVAKSKNDTLKEIHWTKSTRYLNTQKQCTKFNGEVLLDIDPLNNPLKGLWEVDKSGRLSAPPKIGIWKMCCSKWKNYWGIHGWAKSFHWC